MYEYLIRPIGGVSGCESRLNDILGCDKYKISVANSYLIYVFGGADLVSNSLFCETCDSQQQKAHQYNQ